MFMQTRNERLLLVLLASAASYVFLLVIHLLRPSHSLPFFSFPIENIVVNKSMLFMHCLVNIILLTG